MENVMQQVIPISIKKLHPDAIIPEYQSEGAGCFDLHSIDAGQVQPRRAKTFDTGLAIEIPEGFVMLVYSRSGHGFKFGVRLGNGTGIIDSDYRGPLKVRLHNDAQDGDAFMVLAGDRIAQAMIVPVPRVQFQIVDELGETERGTNGFGSTDAKAR